MESILKDWDKLLSTWSYEKKREFFREHGKDMDYVMAKALMQSMIPEKSNDRPE